MMMTIIKIPDMGMEFDDVFIVDEARRVESGILIVLLVR